MDDRDYTSSACGNEAFELSSEYDEYISSQVKRKFPRGLFTDDEVDLEIDDLIQQTHIRFWMALQKRRITNHKAYICFIVRNSIIDLIRRHRRNLSLSMYEYGEMRHGTVFIASGEGMRDPAFEYELKENMLEQMERMTSIVLAVLTLPPVQRLAVFYLLKDVLEDIRPLAKVLKAHHIDIEAIDWPEERLEVYKVRASLYYARKKLRILLREILDD